MRLVTSNPKSVPPDVTCNNKNKKNRPNLNVYGKYKLTTPQISVSIKKESEVAEKVHLLPLTPRNGKR